MVVFGELAAQTAARPGLIARCGQFHAALTMPPGLARHAALVDAYVETCRIAQGCVDEEFARAQEDAATPLHQAAIAALRVMARVVIASWRSDFRELEAPEPATLERLIDLAPNRPVDARMGEGFAFYALYPEACVAAMTGGPSPQTVVVGVRSIGMALAPMLAEAIAASHCFSVRPVGHPFARACHLSPALREKMHALRRRRFLVVDEGPGLSGSTFASVARALQASGVAPDQIAFVASNPAGPGDAATPEIFALWNAAGKRFLDAAPVVNRTLGAHRILRDMSGGAWREICANSDAPANRPYERRKLLLSDKEGSRLATFIGLGDIGARKARIARALGAAGFAPQAGDTAHGFLLQRWIENARRIECAPRPALIAQIADYIAFRARNLPPLPTGGANMQALFEMARANCAIGAGEESAAAVDHFAPAVDRLARIERPVASDNRMHRWEWIVGADGAILKCDAFDHCAAHDLVGCRDPAWDVAGAVVEFALEPDEQDALLARLAKAGVGIAPMLLEFFRLAYCALQLGAAHLAARANARWPQDAQRWRAEGARYRLALRALSLSPAHSL